MSSRTLRFIAGAFAALAAVHVALAIPALRATRQLSEPPFHDTYVEDMFGFRWWALPSAWFVVAVALFIWSRRVTAHEHITA